MGFGPVPPQKIIQARVGQKLELMARLGFRLAKKAARYLWGSCIPNPTRTFTPRALAPIPRAISSLQLVAMEEIDKDSSRPTESLKPQSFHLSRVTASRCTFCRLTEGAGMSFAIGTLTSTSTSLPTIPVQPRASGDRHGQRTRFVSVPHPRFVGNAVNAREQQRRQC